MQEMGNAFEIKRPATQNSLVHIQTAISKLHGNCKPKNNNRYPKKRKSNPNTTLKMVIKSQEKRTKEDQQKKNPKQLRKCQ